MHFYVPIATPSKRRPVDILTGAFRERIPIALTSASIYLYLHGRWFRDPTWLTSHRSLFARKRRYLYVVTLELYNMVPKLKRGALRGNYY